MPHCLKVPRGKGKRMLKALYGGVRGVNEKRRYPGPEKSSSVGRWRVSFKKVDFCGLKETHCEWGKNA